MTLGEVDLYRFHNALLNRASVALNRAAETSDPQNYTILMTQAGVLLELGSALIAATEKPNAPS